MSFDFFVIMEKLSRNARRRQIKKTKNEPVLRIKIEDLSTEILNMITTFIPDLYCLPLVIIKLFWNMPRFKTINYCKCICSINQQTSQKFISWFRTNYGKTNVRIVKELNIYREKINGIDFKSQITEFKDQDANTKATHDFLICALENNSDIFLELLDQEYNFFKGLNLAKLCSIALKSNNLKLFRWFFRNLITNFRSKCTSQREFERKVKTVLENYDDTPTLGEVFFVESIKQDSKETLKLLKEVLRQPKYSIDMTLLLAARSGACEIISWILFEEDFESIYFLDRSFFISSFKRRGTFSFQFMRNEAMKYNKMDVLKLINEAENYQKLNHLSFESKEAKCFTKNRK